MGMDDGSGSAGSPAGAGEGFRSAQPARVPAKTLGHRGRWRRARARPAVEGGPPVLPVVGAQSGRGLFRRRSP